MSGNSFAALAQGVQILGLDAACYAVDTWKGDPHSGFFGEEVFEEWSAFHDRHFGAFSRVVRSTFDEAVTKFQDGSVDLLHIDGFHTYEAVHHDFESWLPKLSPKAVVLLHDVNVRERNFGVWQFWEELKDRYPCFGFLHGHGLGVVGVGRELPTLVRWLFQHSSSDGQSAYIIRQFFENLGEVLVGQRRETVLAEVRTELADRLGEQQAETARLTVELETRLTESAALGAERDTTRQLAAELADRLGEQQAEMARLTAELEARLNESAALGAERDTTRQLAAELADRLGAKEAETTRLTAELEARLKESAALGAERDTTRQLAAELADRLGEQQAETARLTVELEAQLKESTARAERASFVIRAELEKTITELTQQNAAHAAHQVALISALEEVHNSKSWRWTEPLRNARRTTLSGGFMRVLLRGPRPFSDAIAVPMPPSPAQSPAESPVLERPLPVIQSPAESPALERPVPVTLRVSGHASGAPTDARTRTIICLSHVVPTSCRAGNEYRVHRLLTHFRRSGYRVVVAVSPLSEAISEADLDAMAEAYGNVAICERNGHVRFSLKDCPDVLSVLNGGQTQDFAAVLGELEPMTKPQADLLVMDRTFCHDTMVAVLVHLQTTLKPCLVLAEYVWMTRALPLLDADVLTAVDTHDVFSTKRDKVTTFCIADCDVSPGEEARRLARAKLILAIQREEAKILTELAPDRPIVIAGVDFDCVSSNEWPSQPVAFCVGSDNPMNRLGLRDFLRFAWPEILNTVPDARLAVAGRVGCVVPGGTRGVDVLGHVEDLRAWYSRARVVINPAAAGTGLKVKTVEALAHLRPIVAWPNGVDGLPPDIAPLVRPVEDWLEFAERVSGWLRASHSAFDGDTAALIQRQLSADHVYADAMACLSGLFERAGELQG